ncbi:hypothetical protein DZS_02700 [Dickeya ananatis]
MMVLPALMPLISAQRGISYVEIGVALGVFNVVSALVQTPIGFAVDRIGPRRTLIAGLTLGSLCFLSLGFFTSYSWMLIAMALAGLANAVYHPSDYALLSRGIAENRMGRAFSVHTFSGFLGTAVAPAILLTVAALTRIEFALVLSGLLGLLTVPMLLGEQEALPAASAHDKKNLCAKGRGIYSAHPVAAGAVYAAQPEHQLDSKLLGYRAGKWLRHAADRSQPGADGVFVYQRVWRIGRRLTGG